MSSDDSIEQLRQLKKEALQNGGPEHIAARRKQGTGTARERVLGLVDSGSFVELDVFIDGGVTGHGRVNGRDVYVFSQDGEFSQRSPYEAFAQKVVKVVDLAMKNGAPLVGLYDCGLPTREGAWEAESREGAAALGSYSELYFRNVMASGVIPQISAIFGPCWGSAAYSPALTDFTIMVKGSSHLFLDAAEPGDAGAEEEIALEELGGARTHAERGGLAHLAANDEAECLEMIRGLLSYLPQNNLEEPLRSDLFDPADRMDDTLDSLGSADLGQVYDMRDVVGHVVDEREFFEIAPGWAKNLIVGFARLGGRPVGIVGNQPTHLAGRIDKDAAAKGARFVRFCDAFNLPLVTFVDTPGFLASSEREHGTIIRGAAKLMYAYCEATIPKLTLVTRGAYGEAFEVMCSKHIRADFNFAWPCAGVAAVAPDGALDRQDYASPYEAALRGHLDDVIEPIESRPRLIAALEACASKRESRPPKKHGNIPL